MTSYYSRPIKIPKNEKPEDCGIDKDHVDRPGKKNVKDQNRYSPFLTLSLFLSRKTPTSLKLFSLLGKFK
jgi:hypothetical protein